MSGAQNLHRIVGVVPRLRREACEGPCHFRDSHGCPRRAVAALQTWDSHFRGLCERHAAQGCELGYHIYTADGDDWAPREAVATG